MVASKKIRDARKYKTTTGDGVRHLKTSRELRGHRKQKGAWWFQITKHLSSLKKNARQETCCLSLSSPLRFQPLLSNCPNGKKKEARTQARYAAHCPRNAENVRKNRSDTSSTSTGRLEYPPMFLGQFAASHAAVGGSAFMSASNRNFCSGYSV